jgi:hypothetical protein
LSSAGAVTQHRHQAEKHNTPDPKHRQRSMNCALQP